MGFFFSGFHIIIFWIQQNIKNDPHHLEQFESSPLVKKKKGNCEIIHPSRYYLLKIQYFLPFMKNKQTKWYILFHCVLSVIFETQNVCYFTTLYNIFSLFSCSFRLIQIFQMCSKIHLINAIFCFHFHFH